jgi:hypothetical protein
MLLPDFKLETIIRHIHEHGFESLDPAVQDQANAVLQDHVARERFEEIATEPLYWKQSGDRLMAAASLIRATHLTTWGMSDEDVLDGKFDAAGARVKHDMHRVYLFLAGLSVENYAKGAIMKQAAKDYVKDGKIQGLPFHDCLELTKRAKVILTTSEEMTLKCLTTHIQWSGRYPTKKEYNKGNGSWSRIPEDYVNVDEVVNKLLTILSGSRSYQATV